jgi:hypothetical protein
VNVFVVFSPVLLFFVYLFLFWFFILCFGKAVAKADFQTRICFAFLARVVNEYNPGSRYKTTMAQHMDYFSNNAGADKIRNIQSEVDKVKVVMQKNIDDILMRGEKLDKLVEDTDKLEQNSKQFKVEREGSCCKIFDKNGLNRKVRRVSSMHSGAVMLN